MILNEYIYFYERAAASDGAGGKEPGVLTLIAEMYANVKPMSGLLGMQFQQLRGSQGYEVHIRTDHDREPERDYLVRYKGVYGDIDMVIESVYVGRQYTKLICKSESSV